MNIADVIKVEVEDSAAQQKKITVEIEESFVKAEYDKAFKNVTKGATVQGFRKGKAPRSILEKLYGESVLWDVGQRLVGQSYEEALKQQNIRPFGDPAFADVVMEQKKPITYSATLDVIPELELPPRDGWEFDRLMEPIKEESIAEPLENLRMQHAQLVPADEKTIEEDDFAFIDYMGKIDGAEQDKLSGKNAEMQISTKENLLVDFFKAVIGMKKGEQKCFTIKLPKTFPDPALADKDAEFDVTVLSIKVRELPELTDEFVKENSAYESIEDSNKKVRERLEGVAKQNAEQKLRSDIMGKLIENSSFDLPEKMITDYTNMHANRVIEQARWTGVEITQMPDFNREEFDASCKKEGERLAKEEVIIGAISEKEEVKPEPNDIIKVKNEYLEMMKAQSGDQKNSKDAESRAFSLAIKEVTTEAVYKHLISGLKITDKTA